MSAQTVITITLGLLGITYFSVMSRLLSKEDFGYFAIITAITSVLSSISEAGLGSAVIQNKDASKSYIQTAWSLSLVFGISLCTFLYLSAGMVSELMVGSDVLKVGYQIMSISLVFYAINGVGRAVIIKKLYFLKYGVFDIVGYTLSALIGIYLAINGYGFYSVVIAMLLHQLFLGLQILVANRKIIALRFNPKYFRQIITFGGWLTGSVIVRNLTDQLDKLITTKWIPVSTLGEYSRPSGLIFQITGNINGVFDTILFPILSGINDNTSLVKIAYEKSVSLIVQFALVLTALFILGAEIIISVFLGNSWLYLSDVFQIISVSIVLLSYDRVADCFFRSLGIVKQYFLVRCYTLLFTCLCMYIGCQYGIIGLAMGLVASRLICIILKIIYLSNQFAFDRKGWYFKNLRPWGIPLLLFLLCYILKIFLPYGCLLSTSLYCFVLLLIVFLSPKSLGDIFYENFYLVIRGKLNKVYKNK